MTKNQKEMELRRAYALVMAHLGLPYETNTEHGPGTTHLRTQLVSALRDNIEREYKSTADIAKAARAWARWERALRDIGDHKEMFKCAEIPGLSAPAKFTPVTREEERRTSVMCDYTEQMLLDAVEKEASEGG